jgi:hypothetical protein
LTITAASFVAAIALIAGHWFRADLTTCYLPGGTSPAFYNEIHFTFGRGQVRAISSTWRPPPSLPAPLVAGLHLRTSPLVWQSASVDRALLGFNFCPLGVPVASVYTIAFPIWCLLVPCLVPTALWLRRRRRERAAREGFDVIPAPPGPRIAAWP